METEFGVLLGRARRAVALRAHMLHPDLQAGSFLIFGHVCRYGPVRATTVGEMYAIDKGSVSRHVQQLVDMGLIVREPDPADRRAQLLTATDEGRQRLEEIGEARKEPFQQRLSDWSTDEIQVLADTLHRYNAT